MNKKVAIVVIGRNEGDRLVVSLGSVTDRGGVVLYVDSASSDESPERARQLGVEVLSLKAEDPLTAARARNAGFREVRQTSPEVEFVQFVDGDARIADEWISRAAELLEDQADVAVVAGRVREIDRDASVYNRLCDLEWKGPVGDVRSVGGIFMVRASVFEAVGGFDPEVIAGEEAELCSRIIEKRYRVHRLPEDMAGHDAAMRSFKQWWKRAIRGGHAYAEAAARGSGPDIRQVRSFLVWGAAVPAVVLCSAAATAMAPPLAIVVVLAALGYLALFMRISRFRREVGDSAVDSRLYARFCLLGKLPQVLGWASFTWNRLRGRRTKLMEHKGPRRLVAGLVS